MKMKTKYQYLNEDDGMNRNINEISMVHIVLISMIISTWVFAETYRISDFSDVESVVYGKSIPSAPRGEIVASDGLPYHQSDAGRIYARPTGAATYNPAKFLRDRINLRTLTSWEEAYAKKCGKAIQTTSVPESSEQAVLVDPMREPSVAPKVIKIFTEKCQKCHSAGGSGEKALPQIIDLEALVINRFVVPGKPNQSKIWEQIDSNDMPLGSNKLNPDEKKAVKEWITGLKSNGNINNQADNTVRIGSIRPDLEFLCMLKDLNEHKTEDQHYIKYFSFNAGHTPLSAEELRLRQQALSKLLNSLSWNAQIKRPVPIDPLGSIMRIDLRNYAWTEEAWRLILSEQLAKDAPYTDGDRFLFRGSRPPLYYSLLDIPKQDPESTILHRIGRLSGKGDEPRGSYVMAGFKNSGVATFNRVIQGFPTPFGHYWKSYDTNNEKGERNIFANPTHFEFDANEIIFSLPNGMQAYFLINGIRQRLDKGDEAVVRDPERSYDQSRVLNGISCMRCHQTGINPKYDEILEFSEIGFSGDEKAEIQRKYHTAKTLRPQFNASNERFRKAMEEAGVDVNDPDPIFKVVRTLDLEDSLGPGRSLERLRIRRGY